jgi:hypothetical protein
LGRVLAGLVKGFLVGLGVLPLRKRRWAFSVFIKGLQGLGFGSFRKPNHAGYLKSGWRRGRKGHFKSRQKSPRCVSASPGEGVCPVAHREAFISKSCASVVSNLTESHKTVSGGIPVESSRLLVFVGDMTAHGSELAAVQVSAPVSSQLVSTLAGSPLVVQSGSEVQQGVLGFGQVGLPTSSYMPPAGSAFEEVGMEKATGCCFGDGIPIHGCGVGLSSKAALFSETVQGWQNIPVRIEPSDSLTIAPVSLGLELDAKASHLVFGSIEDGSSDDLWLTVTRLELIERFRKAILVTEKNKRIVKQVEENFIRVNNGMCDGVMPAEEAEAVLADYVRDIEEFLVGKRESAHGHSRKRRGMIIVK